MSYTALKKQLLTSPKRWLVTGGAGFIGSHLIEQLLQLDQQVISLDNLSTGYTKNIELAKASATSEQQARLTVIEGDTRDPETCQAACKNVDYILHQAALGSVPRSIDDPIASHDSNVSGTVNIFTAAKNESSVKRVVYASSSSVYGDEPTLPKVEEKTGKLLSPYAATKAICEVYADVFGRCYGLEISGLRYFNVFGSRQDPKGAYAAVIPLWIQSMLDGEQVFINGDGKTSRDFTHVSNVVQANLLAATSTDIESTNSAFNIALGNRIDLNQLFSALRSALTNLQPSLDIPDAIHRDFRDGDITHSLADISHATNQLGFTTITPTEKGLRQTVENYAGTQ
ncbi:MAG: SDR family oxidoreductase [Verrucomicrobiales bacterium]|nr:SDR family oxidoreductase [Verrucomicrobiales bacterium]